MNGVVLFISVVVLNVMPSILGKLSDETKWKLVENVYTHLISDCILFITSDKRKGVEMFRGLSVVSMRPTVCSRTVTHIPSTMNDCSRPLFVVNDDLINHDRIIQILSWPRGNWNPTWLLFNPIENKSLLAQAPLWFDYRVLWVYPIKQNKDLKLIETYRIAMNMQLKWNIYAMWSEKGGLKLKTVARKDFEGAKLKVAGFESKPLMLIDHNNETGEVILGGYFGRIVDVLMERLNFRMQLTEYNDIGNRTKSNAVLGLTSGTIDMLASSLEMAPERLTLFSFTTTLEHSTLEFFLRKPKSVDYISWWNYFEPFPIRMWLSSLMIFLLVCLLSCFTEKHLDWIEEIIYFFSIIYCLHGYPLPTQNTSKRIIILSCLLFSIVIYASYGGVIIANVAVERTQMPFVNMKQMANQKSYSLGSYLRSKVNIEMKEATEGILHELYVNLVDQKTLPLSSNEAFERVCKKKYIHIDYRAVLFDHSIAKCQLITLPQYYVRSSSALGLVKYSPYKRLIDNLIIKMNNFGILQKLKNIKENNPADNQFHQVTLSQIKFPLAIICFSYILSIFVVFFEYLYLFYKSKYKLNRSYFIRYYA